MESATDQASANQGGLLIGFGWFLAIAGAAVLLLSLLMETTISVPGASLYGVDRSVHNTGLLQRQMMTYIGGLSLVLLGGIWIAAGCIIRAVGRAHHLSN